MRFEYTSLVIFYAMTCLLFLTFFLNSVSKSIEANEYLHLENQFKNLRRYEITPRVPDEGKKL